MIIKRYWKKCGWNCIPIVLSVDSNTKQKWNSIKIEWENLYIFGFALNHKWCWLTANVLVRDFLLCNNLSLKCSITHCRIECCTIYFFSSFVVDCCRCPFESFILRGLFIQSPVTVREWVAQFKDKSWCHIFFLWFCAIAQLQSLNGILVLS